MMQPKISSRALLLFSLFFIPAILQAEGRFEKYSLKVEDEITNIITEDLDEDGYMEVLVIHRTSDDGISRFLTIFWQDPAEGFSKDHRTMWNIPDQVGAIDVGDVKPDPGKELVFITEEGVYYAPITERKIGTLTEMMPVQSVVAIASDRHAPYYNFARDYTGDGKDDIMVCGFYNTIIAIQNHNYKFIKQKLNLKPYIEIFAFDIKELMQSPENPFFRVTYSVPQVFSEDYNADGLIDLLVSFRSKVLIFTQDKNGFPSEPVKEYKIELIEDNVTRRRQQPPNIEFGDLDQDGRVDLVAHQSTGRPGKMEARSVLFWGKSDNIEKGIPDQEFFTEIPAIAGAFILDVNGDGLEDLMIPTYDLNVWSGAMILVTGQISVDWTYFIQSPDHTFTETPSRVITTDLRFNVSKFRLESGIPNVVGDFNGDGIPDQALGEDENILGITLRDKQGKPLPIRERIKVPVSIFNRVTDLNNDGLSDIVIFYFQQPETSGVLNILLNRGPWTIEEDN
jgi:hypothetical protein